MRATVLTDATLAKQAGRFVWLSIDTEDAKNAGFLDRYPWEAVPTFEVLDAKTEKVAYSWIGAVDAPELLRRFDALVLALSLAGKNDECAKRALELLPSLPPAAVKANVASTGLDCALSAAEDAAWRGSALATLEAAVREAVGYSGLLDDDRSGLHSALVDARRRQGDEAGAQAAAATWLDWLDVQAQTAASVEARAALDGYRVSAALSAKAPERVVDTIRRSEQELPNDYNPPARLALVYREMGRYDDAIAASDRALSKVYGPRKLTLLDARATILEKKGDTAGAKAILEDAIAYASTLPKSQRPKGLIARIEKRLGQVGSAD
jgi:tetratricopeptide (TPR) repeat protein